MNSYWFFGLGTLPTAHFHAKIRFLSHLFFLRLNGFKKNHSFKESPGRMLYKGFLRVTAEWNASMSRALSYIGFVQKESGSSYAINSQLVLWLFLSSWCLGDCSRRQMKNRGSVRDRAGGRRRRSHSVSTWLPNWSGSVNFWGTILAGFYPIFKSITSCTAVSLKSGYIYGCIA